LLELIIVIAIIGMLAALVLPNLFGASEDAKIKTTETQMASLDAALQQFRAEFGQFPTEVEGLAVLLEQPASLLTKSKSGLKESKPFLQKNVLPRDGWGNPFVYKLDDNFGFDLISYGSDGQPGGEGNAADLSYRGTTAS
jgi:general secretion pathway protein G